MAVNYRLTPQADKDLEDIFLYSAKKWGIKQAETYLKKLDAHINKLAQNKVKGKSCDLLIWQSAANTDNLLYYKTEKHYVIFRIVNNSIEVLTFIHASMDLDHHINQLTKALQQ